MCVMRTVGMRELRQNLSVYLRALQEDGEPFEVTDRGRPRTPLPFLRKVVRATLLHAGAAGEERESERDCVFPGVGAAVSWWADGGRVGCVWGWGGAGRLRDGGGGAGF